MKIIDIGFMTESWNVKDKLTEDLQLRAEGGVTQRSLENAKRLIKRRGIPKYIKLHFNDDDWYVVRAVWPDNSIHDFTGFSWGYRGEGPHGLAEFFKMIGVPHSIDDIASWPERFEKEIEVSNKETSTEAVDQMELPLNDPRTEPTPEPKPKAEEPYDPMNDTELINRIKGMLAEYNKTKDKALLRPIMEEMAKLYAPEAKEIVDKLENDKFKTTRGNYGKYMSVLSSLKGIHQGAMVFALRDAGAGRGLDDALMVIRGE